MLRWTLSAELEEREQRVARDLQRVGKFYVFLRRIQPRLFDEGFQAELARAYGTPRGTEPKPPALLAMVTLLQAYDRVGDAEAVVTARMDLRWQLVLGCIGAEKAPFSQGVLVDFRDRMTAHDLDKKLLDRTVQLAKETGLFGWQHLKAMLDSSPLLGAGRVEDTWNLIGRALDTVVECAAAGLSVPRQQVLDQAGLKLLSGTSLKATLDIDWDDPAQQAEALRRLLAEVEALRKWVNQHAGKQAMAGPLKTALDALQRVLGQDLEPDPSGGMRIRRGVAKDRMPSLGDKEMRHGRKSKAKAFNGYKRHIVGLAGTDLIAGAVVRPANAPEHEALAPLLEDARRHGEVEEVLIDRGYLASTEIAALRSRGVAIRAKPWPSRNAGRFTKEDFTIRLEQKEITCPANERVAIRHLGSVVHFPASACGPCSLRPRCTVAASGRGRSISIHEQEDLLVELRGLRRTPEGRAALRERTAIEHRLARIYAVQGPRARYKGARKNTLDVRRCAVVNNLQVLQRAA
jgi:IS5 family transposase